MRLFIQNGSLTFNAIRLEMSDAENVRLLMIPS